jgi:hypothetical protein
MAVLSLLEHMLGALACCGSDEAPDPDGRPTHTQPRTLEIADTYKMPGNPEWLLEGFGHVWTSSGDVLITDDWIWATSSDDNTVVRVAR